MKKFQTSNEKKYLKFISDEFKYLEDAEIVIKKWHKNNDDEQTTKVWHVIRPKTLLFKQNGNIILLLDSKLDFEHGLGLDMEKFVIGPQDMFL